MQRQVILCRAGATHALCRHPAGIRLQLLCAVLAHAIQASSSHMCSRSIHGSRLLGIAVRSRQQPLCNRLCGGCNAVGVAGGLCRMAAAHSLLQLPESLFQPAELLKRGSHLQDSAETVMGRQQLGNPPSCTCHAHAV